MNPDGTMMRGQQVRDYAEVHGLPLVSVAELAAHMQAERELSLQQAA